MRTRTKIILGGLAVLYFYSRPESGIASWYGKDYHGRTTASGEPYDMWAMTAAHKKLPFGTKVRVKDVDTGKTVVVRINDRGPFIWGRIIDLSKGAAIALGSHEKGLANVEIRKVF